MAAVVAVVERPPARALGTHLWLNTSGSLLSADTKERLTPELLSPKCCQAENTPLPTSPPKFSPHLLEGSPSV